VTTRIEVKNDDNRPTCKVAVYYEDQQFPAGAGPQGVWIRNEKPDCILRGQEKTVVWVHVHRRFVLEEIDHG